jgi:thymidylate synthase (FAD)
MKATLVAHTQLALYGLEEAWPEWERSTPGGKHADILVEGAGRACYQSWSNPSGRDNRAYLANIIRQGHFSVLEHASATFYIEGVSRSLTHELVRHRHFSFSQLSQRFVKMEDAGYVVPPALRDLLDEYMLPRHPHDLPIDTVRDELSDTFELAKAAYARLVALLEAKGLPRKAAREAARAVLPNMVETSIVVTGNHRSWREFVQKRHTADADAEIRELAGVLLGELRRIAPNIYQDIPEEAAE